jgi:ABC-type branched-subunit amino acid transport system ATPase component
MDIADCGYVMIEGKIVAHNTCASLKQDKIMEKVFSGTFE